MVRLRNVRTGEIREIESQSDEFQDLIAERYDAGSGVVRPSWEQTGEHHARRLEGGDAQVDHDFGYEDKPVHVPGLVRAEDILPDARVHEALTAAERESGLDSYEQKSSELEEMRGVLTEHDPIGSTPLEDRLKSGLERVTGDSSPKRREVRRASRKPAAASSAASSSGGSDS